MIDISSAKLTKVAVHHVGNKLREEGIHLSSVEQKLDQSLTDLLTRKLLKPLAQKRVQQEFTHETDIKYNEVFNFCISIFQKKDSFINSTINIAKHLYSSSTHPKIPSGDLICLLFDNIIINENKTQALLLAKTDKLDKFIKIDNDLNKIEITSLDGIYLENIKKSAIIYSNKTEVFCSDTKSNETRYWTQNFLNTRPSTTNEYIRDFASNILSTGNKISKSSERNLMMQEKLREISKNQNGISISQIRQESSEIYGPEIATETINMVSNKLGKELNEDTNVPFDTINKILLKMNQNMEVFDGVHVKITNPDMQVSYIEKENINQDIKISITLKVRNK
ncbi:hypothetical protein C9939_00725 [Pseudidiomarina aestuarii]|nr:hypothetical protein C9939_00725 [Pseudidiomarina aestuarii]